LGWKRADLARSSVPQLAALSRQTGKERTDKVILEMTWREPENSAAERISSALQPAADLVGRNVPDFEH